MKRSIPFRLRIYISILAGVLVFGTLGLMAFERLDLLDAFYFVIVTIATVGYGDIHPVTAAGKVLVMLIIVTGVGCFVGVAANSIENMIDEREKRERLEKLNMAIGTFFSEMGTQLLRMLSAQDPAIAEIGSVLVVTGSWTPADFARARSVLEHHAASPDSRDMPLPELHGFLMEHKRFLMALLENPQMIEHDRFIPLLQALFHLSEELGARDRLTGLPASDYTHLSGDIGRVYHLLLLEWLEYMQYLKQNYPYLFSLAMRRNPFDRNASVVVQS